MILEDNVVKFIESDVYGYLYKLSSMACGINRLNDNMQPRLPIRLYRSDGNKGKEIDMLDMKCFDCTFCADAFFNLKGKR